MKYFHNNQNQILILIIMNKTEQKVLRVSSGAKLFVAL